MSNKLHKYHRQCARKNAYHTRKTAKRKAKEVKKRTGKDMIIYECPHCSKLHLATYSKQHNARGCQDVRSFGLGRVVYTTSEYQEELNEIDRYL